MKTSKTHSPQIAPSTRMKDGIEVLDVTRYVPHFFASINNELTRGASNVYRQRFGIGVSEWRALSCIAIQPGITAGEICDIIKLDKAVISRALANLEELEYLDPVTSERDARKRRWWLSEKGFELHAQIIKVAIQRENVLLAGAAAEDLEATLRVMRLMLANLDNL